MGGAVEAFFLGLGQRGRADLPPRIRGSIRVDLVDGGHTDHWYVDMTAEDAVVVTQEAKPADTVMTTTHEFFERLIRGDTPLIAALFRNEATSAGDPRLVLTFRRFFPAPSGTLDPREVARRQALHGPVWRERLRKTAPVTPG
ncbi:SCP2 sterol-binding domain-containing protein [Micromonospora sp. WMMD558]|uniref:SCP2 sterol-binding domain-containing protein n=1 Tax=unclassified Micromonospora TaxID=2617518 RepID=UPI0012B4853E|nr:SCP2 sterol-binding domain-containing protein [Micromonospora sp. WMMC415]QGN47747.1 hypothetical protein GKC29_13390 [Micromonospora sp. WMMC415]